MDIELLIDTSFNMASTDPDGSRLDAVKNFVNRLSGDYRFGVINVDQEGAYDRGYDVGYDVGDLTSNKTAVLNAIDSLRDRHIGQTSISGALSWAEYRLNNVTDRRKVIILVTDGGNDRDPGGPFSPTINSTVENAKTYGIQIYTIGVSNDANPFLLDDRIAKPTGGKYFPVANVNQVAGVIESIPIGKSLASSVDIKKLTVFVN